MVSPGYLQALRGHTIHAADLDAGGFEVPALPVESPDVPPAPPSAPSVDEPPPLLKRPPEPSSYAAHVAAVQEADKDIPSQPPASVGRPQEIANAKDHLQAALQSGGIDRATYVQNIAALAAEEGALKTAGAQKVGPSTWEAIKHGANRFVDEQGRVLQAAASWSTDGLIPAPKQGAAPAAPPPPEAAGEPVLAQGAGSHEAYGTRATGSSGGGVIPAHEQPIVAPARQEALKATFPKEAAAEYEALQHEAEGHEAAAAAMSEAVHNAEQEHMAALEDRAYRQQLVGQMLQDAHNAARDVAAKKVDPERFWKSRTTGQQIAYTIALALGGFAHDHTAANTIQHLIDLDVEAQRANIENGHKTVQDKMSMFHAALQSTNSMDLAQQQDIATKLNYAMLKVKEQAEESQAPIIRARAQALLAQMDRKQIEVGIAMNKYIPAQAVTAGPGPLAGQVLDVDPEQLYELPGTNGQALLVGKGMRKEIVDTQIASNVVQREAEALKALLGHDGNGIDSPEKYQDAWAHLAAIASAQPQTMGRGSGKSLGQLQIYMNKLGFGTDPKQPPGPQAYYTFRAKNAVYPVGAGSIAAINAVQEAAEEGKIETLRRNSLGYVGRIVPGPADRKGVSKLQFVATGRFEPGERQERAPQRVPTVPLPAAPKPKAE